ncbi:hypothetical protein RJT34_03224 [Clitoria ternatea]|uniref:Uncharacterized protein n=1 Tax=Clitoria ternatea TaxID=43366 RepID=A0AAN9KLB8_CLITE
MDTGQKLGCVRASVIEMSLKDLRKAESSKGPLLPLFRVTSLRKVVHLLPPSGSVPVDVSNPKAVVPITIVPSQLGPHLEKEADC